MLYHAERSSLVFFAECYIITDSDVQIQNYKNEVQLEPGAANENIVQNHLYIALLNIF